MDMENIFIWMAPNTKVNGLKTNNMYNKKLIFQGKGTEIWPDKAKYTG